MADHWQEGAVIVYCEEATKELYHLLLPLRAGVGLAPDFLRGFLRVDELRRRRGLAGGMGLGLNSPG